MAHDCAAHSTADGFDLSTARPHAASGQRKRLERLIHSSSDVAKGTRSQVATTWYLAALRITPYTETRQKLKLEVPIFDTYQLILRAGKDLF